MKPFYKHCFGVLLCAGSWAMINPAWSQSPTAQQLEDTGKLLQAQAQATCTAPSTGLTQFFRLYNKSRADHLYTADPAERDSAGRVGYSFEGSVGMIYTQQVTDTVPLYRLYHPGNVDHFYTTDVQERQRALSMGFQDEKIAGYVFPPDSLSTCNVTPLYRMFKTAPANDHFYTTDSVERVKAATQDGYTSEGRAALLVIDPAALKEQKNPVIIVGGTFAPEPLYWILESRLATDGYFRRFFQLPRGGTIDINQSAMALNSFVDTVLRESGASKVHLIGHSQGTAVARTYLKNHNAYSKVDSMISLGGPNKGTRFTESPAARLFGCPAAPPCEQMSVGSTLVQNMNMRPANDPVFYTNFVTDNDLLVVPRDNGFMDNCDRTNAVGEKLACNIHIQASCPHRFLEHIGLATDGTVYSGIRLAMQHEPIILNCHAL